MNAVSVMTGVTIVTCAIKHGIEAFRQSGRYGRSPVTSGYDRKFVTAAESGAGRPS